MMIRVLLTVMLLAVPAGAVTQPQSSTMSWDGRPAARSEALFRAAIMQAHNQERTRYGADPLVWDERLAAHAATYARTLANENRFVHDSQSSATERQGENLWMGTRSAYAYASMTDSWVSERQFYRPGRFPDISHNGNWASVGHYTQVVWPGTKTVGCAIASNAENDYLVCRYLPAGNVIGFAMR